MTSWIHVVSQFSATIRSGADFSPGELLCPNYAGERGVEVYRNNYRGNLHDTLAGAYPVIRQLVGEQFFRLLAKRYIEQHPSRSGNLHRYGSELAEFLSGFEPTQHLAYLPDMARLEWAYHRAYFSDDQPPLDIARLGTRSPHDYGLLRWKLHPGCTLLTSAFPLAAIWQAHQQDSPENFHIDFNTEAERLLVHRSGLEVEIAHIDAASHHWLMQLHQGHPMGAVSDATLYYFPDFDLATALRRWHALGVLVDFE